jgi:hypothetical protein
MKLLIFVLVFNFFSTWYFGWNMHPQSDLEHASDHLCLVLIAIGCAQIMWRADMKDKDK